MRRASRWAATAVIAVVPGGCSGDAGSAPAAEVIDSAGVRIVTYDLTNGTVPTYRIVAEHDLQIGVRDGTPEYTFSRIPDLDVAPDGSIVVSDGVAQELRVFDMHGVYRRTIGRRGDGPGEFATAPVIVGLAGDTVFAFDSRSSRVTSFTIEGELIEITTLRPESIGRPSFMIRQRDGTYLSQSRWVNPSRLGEVYEIRLDLDSIVISHLDATGALIDTVAVKADRKLARRVRGRGDGTFSTVQAQPPYVARAFVRSDGARPLFGRSNSLELELMTSGGEVRTVLRVLGAEHPATADEIRTRQEAAVREALGDGEIDPMTWMLNVEFLPDRLPAFANIVVSNGGDVWVALMEYDRSGGYDWLVFNPVGELRGVVHTPPDMQLFEVRSDFIVGVAFDELDVPYVRRYPLHPSPE